MSTSRDPNDQAEIDRDQMETDLPDEDSDIRSDREYDENRSMKYCTEFNRSEVEATASPRAIEFAQALNPYGLGR